MITKSSNLRIAVFAASFVFLAACGNKGPLVMPQKPVSVPAQPVSETPPTPVEPAHQPQAESTEGSQSAEKGSDGK